MVHVRDNEMVYTEYTSLSSAFFLASRVRINFDALAKSRGRRAKTSDRTNYDDTLNIARYERQS